MPYINLLNHTLIYTQHAPLPVQASFVFPDILASKINQFSKGGILNIKRKIINKLNAALKLFVLMFLLSISNCLIPENSILIKWSPITPNINGVKKLIYLGKKEVIFLPKKLFNEKSTILKIKNRIPELVKKLRTEQNKFVWFKAASAIMTTDTRPKVAYEETKIGNKTDHITGIVPLFPKDVKKNIV